ncbi:MULTISPECIES: serine acetyltransferase [unclassified Mucilaginibacter]|uniref:serine acetyltransferase n=1 Tax=unclassified Mucilaginibacter TaxID=2617802 RepID=UPI002AC8FFD9|nr:MULTISPECIES: serine acetyltransferase [unclassified Mucilaginibacter]MEB0264083.1 serine acetyltransferase [Mucilaginibacter sp. 10I4]MEB0278537.1 serine acetyltransferase [Mucilaginibacter sp. 10B2]MEB0299248.1 serine acetyltransferase [Mucilaginibacter sp. 5C4]WPX23507.1 serine acetyltransferase [Mucilaginibacter sp. 5C4]
MNFFAYLFQDWSANRGNIKGQLVLFLFRSVQIINRNTLLKILFCWHLIMYHIVVEWHLGIELPRKLTAGKGLIVYHGQALVVNQGVIIGENCVLRNSVTIGHKKLANGTFTACPRLGNNVDVGANVCIIGDVTIGNNVIIGAGAVVIKDIPDNSVAVGNPARILEQKTEAATRIENI